MELTVASIVTSSQWSVDLSKPESANTHGICSLLYPFVSFAVCHITIPSMCLFFFTATGGRDIRTESVLPTTQQLHDLHLLLCFAFLVLILRKSFPVQPSLA